MRKIRLRKFNELFRDEGTWLYMSLALASMMLVVLVAGLAWTFQAYTPSADFESRSNAVYRALLVGGAFVTLFTVVWRGLVAKRQVDAQVAATENQTKQIEYTREQVELARRQAVMNEKSDTTKTLQKGAELIASSENAHRQAGYATLQNIIRNENEFRTEAVGLLVEKMEVLASEDFNSRETRRVSEIVRSIANIEGVTINQEVLLDGSKSNPSWRSFPFLRRIQYVGGVVYPWNVSEEYIQKEGMYFDNVRIEDMKEPIKIEWPKFKACRFVKCKIGQIDGYFANESVFENCDFSDCVINTVIVTTISGTGNYYDKVSPPRNADNVLLDAGRLSETYKLTER